MATNDPSKKRKREPNFTDPKSLVIFLVGSGKAPKKFIIHKERVCHHSPVLRAAFNGNFAEGQTQIYRIEDTSPGAFRLFTQWIYCQDLDPFQLKNQKEKINDVRWDMDEPGYVEDMELAKLWVLADKMAMPRLQNSVVEKIIRIRQDNVDIPITSLRYIYDRTVVDSPLRRLMVSEVSQYCSEHNFINNSEYFPHGLLINIVRKQIRNRPKGIVSVEPNPSEFFVPVSTEAAQTEMAGSNANEGASRYRASK